jgi:dephospho-CoA kinase
MLRIGLTGGIGSGKSEVARRFAALGIPVIDTDLLAREVLAPGQPLLQEILDTFGRDLRLKDGSLDRGALRTRVFEEPGLRKRLEAMTHPRIALAMEDRVAALATQTPYVVLVIPLLFEAGWQEQVDRVLVVDCPETMQVERIARRDGISVELAWSMVRSQASREQRKRGADDVIDNGPGGDAESLDLRVRDLDRCYRECAHSERRDTPA